MNISKHDQKLILVLLGLAIFLAAYLGIASVYNDRKDEVEEQISELEAQVEVLRTFEEERPTYEAEISRIGDSISEELAKYPEDIRSEDLVMYVTELESKTGVEIGGVSIVAPEVISRFNVPERTGSSYQLIPVAALKTGISISCKLNYEQLKKLIDYINENDEKTDISEVYVNYDQQSGTLSGRLSIDRYFIATENYTYSPTKIPTVRKGISDPFGTLKITESETASNTDTGTN